MRVLQWQGPNGYFTERQRIEENDTKQDTEGEVGGEHNERTKAIECRALRRRMSLK